MAVTALFINGIFDSVLEEILEAQSQSRSGGWSCVVEPDGFDTSNLSSWREGLGMMIELEQEADGRWIAEVADLPGVVVYGDSPRDEI